MYIKYHGKYEAKKKFFFLNKWELKEQRFLINKYYTIYSEQKKEGYIINDVFWCAICLLIMY